MWKYIYYRTRSRIIPFIETVIMWTLITFSLILFIFIGMYVNRCLFRVDYSQVCMQTQWERSMGWVSLIPKAPYALYKSTTKTIKQWLR